MKTNLITKAYHSRPINSYVTDKNILTYDYYSKDAISDIKFHKLYNCDIEIGNDLSDTCVTISGLLSYTSLEDIRKYVDDEYVYLICCIPSGSVVYESSDFDGSPCLISSSIIYHDISEINDVDAHILNVPEFSLYKDEKYSALLNAKTISNVDFNTRTFTVDGEQYTIKNQLGKIVDYGHHYHNIPFYSNFRELTEEQYEKLVNANK